MAVFARLAMAMMSAAATPLTFTHLSSTWTIDAHDGKLHVTADCAEDTWCGFGFNKDKPAMDGADVFTFGFHNGVDLPDCPMGCGCGCGCGTTKAPCGCGCGTTPCGCGKRRLSDHSNPYIPRVRDLKVHLPVPSAPTAAKNLDHVGGVVGIAMNSVLFVHEHPKEGMTWLFDNCGGHGDTYGHYHYHAPPLCLLKSLGVPVPEKGSWWKTQGADAWPLQGPEIQVGWALDGAPIMSPFKSGARVEKASLDECHGAIDEVTGEYRYYLVPTAPYMPPCLRGAQIGNVTSFRQSKDGQPCSKSHAAPMQTSIVHGGKVLSGTGCPEHAMFKKVHSGQPFGQKFTARRLHNHGCGCGSKKYGTCPAGGACGCGCGCGTSACGCGCGTSTCGCGCGTTKAPCGCGCGTSTCGCGCGTTKAPCGCGCGTSTCGCGCGTTKAPCGCGCGTSTCGCGCGTTKAPCGCGCGTSTCGCGCGTTKAPCGCGCGPSTCGCGCGTSTCGCGCGTNACGCGSSYACPGQMFCAMGLTKKTSTGTPVSLSQCNLQGHSITIDAKQDLTDYTLTFENGRMKVSAHRAFDTGDDTDYVLSQDTPYYILLTVGQTMGTTSAIQVGYHGSASTQTLVCLSTLSQKGECKLASEWSGPPSRAVRSLPLGVQNVALAGTLVSLGMLSLALQGYTALARSLLVACVRCVAQLYLAGGILLTYLLSTRHPGVVWSWIFFTGLFAATEATARVEYVYPKLFRHMATSILMALSLVLSSSLFLGVLTPEPYWSPRTWIPVSGMILGNSVTACALAAAKVTDALATERQTLELRLVRGANWKEALRSVLRTTLSTSLTPIINALSVTGIVHIPGMMTGQLLSGQSPFTAAAYQVLIFFLIAASTTTTVQVVSQLAVRTLVDQKQHRLQLDDLRARPREEQPPCRGLRKVMREMLRGVSAKPAQVRAMRPVKILDDHDDHGDSEGSTETKTGGEALVKQLQVTLDGHVSPLTLHRGDRVALLGPSGIGKSRMLRRIAGLEPGGVEVEDAVEWRRQVSLVPQGQANLEGTPRDFLKEVLSYGSQSLTRDEEPEKLLEELAREWDVDPSLLSQPWNTLSGGQAQRISLAIAVCLKPEVLLLDESTSALDEATTLKVEKSLRARGTPILMVSHSSSQVDRFCNRRIQLAWND